MRDADIRVRLQAELAARFSGDLIRSELGLCLGETRVDLAVVNGHLHGYEIKSDRDTLTRLPTQIALYDRVLDYSTIACGPRYLKRVVEHVPSRWGIILATESVDGLELRHFRTAKINRSLDRLAIAQLVWRDEAAEILQSRGQVVRRHETRWDLWDRLAQLPLRILQRHVRSSLKERRAWPGG